MKQVFYGEKRGEIMAEITINIDDYMTPDDIKVECMTAVRQAVFNMYGRNENEIRRLITNLSYEFIFKAVSDCIGEDAKALIVNKVKELLEKDDSSIKYNLWRKKDVYESNESPAVTILHEAIKDNKQMIRNKVMQHIDTFDFGDVQTAVYEGLNNILYEKIFSSK